MLMLTAKIDRRTVATMKPLRRTVIEMTDTLDRLASRSQDELALKASGIVDGISRTRANSV